MVEVNEDALAVTMKIRRETRVAKERAEAERAFARQGELQVPAPVPGERPAPAPSDDAVVQVAVPPPVTHRPVDAETSFRRARLGVVAALALVLLLVWIMQRRARRLGSVGGAGDVVKY